MVSTTSTQPVAPPIVGSFGPYLLVRKLGSGGMGTVYIVRTPWPDRPVAALKRELLGEDKAAKQRFRHEMALAVRLEHPNLITAFDVGSVDDEPYVCSQLILGKDLGAICRTLEKKRAVGPFPIALSLMFDLLSALHYVHHAKGDDGSPLRLVHRDVKPGNIIVGYDGPARLADFGAATSALTAEMQLTRPGEVVGSPASVAPDVLRLDPATPASDIYALGSAIYRFVAGVHPHEAATTREMLMKVLHGEARPLSRYRPDLPTWFIEVLHRMLANEARARPSSADLLRILHAKKAQGTIPPVAHEAVGQWLMLLFQDVYPAEIAEYEQIQRLAVEPTEIGRTAVFARRDSAARILAEPLDNPQRTDVDLPADLLAEPVLPGATVEEDGITTSPEVQKPDLLSSSVTTPDTFSEKTEPGAPHPQPASPFASVTTVSRPPPASGVHEPMLRRHADPASTQPGHLTFDDLVKPAKPEANLEPTLPPPTAKRTLPFWSMGLLVIFGLVIGLGGSALVQWLSADGPANVIVAEGAMPTLADLKEELNRRRVEMRARVQDGQTVPQAAWLMLDRAWSSLEAGDQAGARRALTELGAALDQR